MGAKHLAGVYIQLRGLPRVIANHGNRVFGLPEDLDGCTTLIGVGKTPQEIGARRTFRAIETRSTGTVGRIVTITLRVKTGIVLESRPADEQLAEQLRVGRGQVIFAGRRNKLTVQ